MILLLDVSGHHCCCCCHRVDGSYPSRRVSFLFALSCFPLTSPLPSSASAQYTQTFLLLINTLLMLKGSHHQCRHCVKVCPPRSFVSSPLSSGALHASLPFSATGLDCPSYSYLGIAPQYTEDIFADDPVSHLAGSYDRSSPHSLQCIYVLFGVSISSAGSG
jgi:hypothetical protein